MRRGCHRFSIEPGQEHLDRHFRLALGVQVQWAAGLRARGLEVFASPPGDQSFGHAQAISITSDGILVGAADPRSGDGAFAGW